MAYLTNLSWLTNTLISNLFWETVRKWGGQFDRKKVEKRKNPKNIKIHWLKETLVFIKTWRSFFCSIPYRREPWKIDISSLKQFSTYLVLIKHNMNLLIRNRFSIWSSNSILYYREEGKGASPYYTCIRTGNGLNLSKQFFCFCFYFLFSPLLTAIDKNGFSFLHRQYRHRINPTLKLLNTLNVSCKQI
jgi:hypothetical protein